MQQLLESPQPVRETRTVLDEDREKMERIVSPPPVADLRSGDGEFGGGEASPGFRFGNSGDEDQLCDGQSAEFEG